MLSLFIVIYIAVTLAIGYWASQKIRTSGDFTLAGKSLSAPFVGVTLFATWFGSNHIMGNPGYFVEGGFSSFFSLIIPGGLALFTVGRFYARKLYRLNLVTVGDFFKFRYDKKLDTAISVILILAYPVWIASQLVALGFLLTQVFGTDLQLGIILGAGIVLIYTYIGGMWAVTYTDMLQSWLILLGLVILMVHILGETGGMKELFKDKPTSFFSILPKSGVSAWSEYIALILALFVGSIPGQEIYQRIFSAKSEKSAVNGLYLGGLLIVIVPIVPAIIGIGVSSLHPELMQVEGGQNLLPSYVSGFTSLPIQILFYGALISSILSTSSGAMLAPATIIGENLIKPFSPNISDKSLLLWIRSSVVIIAVASVYFALTNSNIVGLLVASLSLILVCIFAPFTFGLFWKKASRVGAWLAIFSGGFTWLLCGILKTTIDPIIYGTLISCSTMFIGSLLWSDDGNDEFNEINN